MKRFLAGMLALIMVLSICGCGSHKTPEEVFALTAENMKKMDSGIYYITQEMGVREDSVEVGGRFHTELEVCPNPRTVHGKFDLSIAVINLKTEFYWLPEEDSLYLGIDMGSGPQWHKQNHLAEQLPELPEAWRNPGIVMLDYCENLTEVGREKVEGVNTTHYDVRLTAEGLWKLVQKSLDVIDEENGGTPKELVGLREHLQELFAEVDENAGVTLTVFINTKKMELVEVRADFAEFANEIYRAFRVCQGEDQPDDTDVGFAKLSVVSGFRELGRVDHIEIAQDILNAPEM